MKIVCPSPERGETVIREVAVFQALAGSQITEVRLDGADFQKLIELIQSEVGKDRIVHWLQHMHCRFIPEGKRG